MKKMYAVLAVILSIFAVSCGGGTSNNNNTTTGDPPVVQLLLKMDADAGIFLGALKGSAPFQNHLSELAFDPDGDDLVSYSWSFSDGTSSTEEEPSPTFASEGKYTATLTVTDNEGETCDASLTMVVTSSENDAPAVMIDANKLTGSTATTFIFTALTDDDEGDILSYSWDLGDNTTSTDRIVTHVYTSTGHFRPSVTVTDANGNTSTAHICILVKNIAEDPNYFNIVCDPNPAEFVHTAASAFIELEVAYGNGTPQTWFVKRGLPGAPLQTQDWDANHFLDVSGVVVEDSPPRIESYMATIEARGTNRVEIEKCVVFVYHYCDTVIWNDATPPTVDLKDGGKVIYTPPGHAFRGEDYEIAVRVVDSNNIPQMGAVTIALHNPEDESDIATEMVQLNLVGNGNVSIAIPPSWSPGETQLTAEYQTEILSLGTVIVE